MLPYLHKQGFIQDFIQGGGGGRTSVCSDDAACIAHRPCKTSCLEVDSGEFWEVSHYYNTILIHVLKPLYVNKF